MEGGLDFVVLIMIQHIKPSLIQREHKRKQFLCADALKASLKLSFKCNRKDSFKNKYMILYIIIHKDHYCRRTVSLYSALCKNLMIAKRIKACFRYLPLSS